VEILRFGFFEQKETEPLRASQAISIQWQLNSSPLHLHKSLITHPFFTSYGYAQNRRFYAQSTLVIIVILSNVWSFPIR
jgi:hypothetical protein